MVKKRFFVLHLSTNESALLSTCSVWWNIGHKGRSYSSELIVIACWRKSNSFSDFDLRSQHSSLKHIAFSAALITWSASWIDFESICFTNLSFID